MSEARPTCHRQSPQCQVGVGVTTASMTLWTDLCAEETPRANIQYSLLMYRLLGMVLVI